MPFFGRRQRATAVAAPPVPAHAVHFYEEDEALIARLEQYVVEGARLGELTVVIATPVHRQMLRERLAESSLEEAFLGLDAQDTLNRFMVGGLPDPQLFELTVGALVRERVGGGLRAYGEMVSLLWQQDNIAGTIQLEALWNALQATVDFPLLCAYGITQFDGRDGLSDVCELHTHVLPLAS
jgi:hypothetical protein